MKFNVAFAALLVAGILAMLAGFVSRTLVPEHDLGKDVVTVEAAEAGGAGAAKAALPEPILGLIAAADVERGKSVAKACAACHVFDKGGPNGVGPGLYGVVGHKKQAHDGFAYSGTLAEKGGDVWTLNELNHFLWKPKAYAKGTKMSFAGVKKPEDRAALIAYMRTLSDSPVALPSQGDIDAELAELSPPPEEKVDAATEDKEGTSPDPASSSAAPEKDAKSDDKAAKP